MSCLGKVTKIEPLEPMVFELQKHYSEKIFNKLCNNIYRIMFAYLKSWNYFCNEEIEDIIQNYYLHGFEKSIKTFDGSSSFVTYVINIVRLRALDLYSQKKKRFYYEFFRVESFDYTHNTFDEQLIRIDYHIPQEKCGAIAFNYKSTLTKIYLKEDINKVLNAIVRIENKDYRRILLSFIIFDFRKNKDLLQFIRLLYYQSIKALDTHFIRAKENLSNLLKAYIDTSTLLEIRKFVVLKNCEIYEIVNRIVNCKDHKKLTDQQKEDIKEDKKEIKIFLEKIINIKDIVNLFQIGDDEY
jgi:DNA-directed RNA polymerase specialized sigma24 family protein